MRLDRFLTEEERQRMGDESVARGGYRNGVAAGFVPGTGWFQPFYFDPGKPETDNKGVYPCQRGNPFLSVHYWRDWSAIRPPICIVGPNGQEWEIDRKSSNGDGWIVTGEWPRLTCSPSIVLRGYHGFLRDGEFTPDIEGRGPNGVAP